MIKIIHFNTHDEYINWLNSSDSNKQISEASIVSYCDEHTNIQIKKSRFHKQGCVSMKRYTEMVQETIIGRILTTTNEYETVPVYQKQKLIELWEYTFKEMLPKDPKRAVDIADAVVDAFTAKFKNLT